MSDQRVNCFNCTHFYTTWDPKFPRGCKAFNFKTDIIPSLRVFQSSGKSCMKFQEKRKRGS
nr:uracil-DNA glycosylase [Bacillus sp. SM2101]